MYSEIARREVNSRKKTKNPGIGREKNKQSQSLREDLRRKRRPGTIAAFAESDI
ncbi:hypothetical protein F0562_034309 [Nyssa sinensis]|uniref:Uncharacterized protein n=1 Tax=Nyssa sinensis TaxID=561372 RepID=A0A5J5AKD1_9ASTE|nr:hypothetical protein F0562_034309 [Nyssa sinensis]